jgi:hypothetical protein
MSEKFVGAEALSGFRVVVMASRALSKTTWMEAARNRPEGRQ